MFITKRKDQRALQQMRRLGVTSLLAKTAFPKRFATPEAAIWKTGAPKTVQRKGQGTQRYPKAKKTCRANLRSSVQNR